MNRQHSLRSSVLTFLSSLSLLIAGAGYAPMTLADGNVGPAVEGTWLIRIIGGAGAPFVEVTNIASVGRDGQLVNVDPVLGTAVGEVSRMRDRQFRLGFWGIADQGGFPVRYEVRATARLIHQDLMGGDFRTVLTDLSGNLLAEYVGTIEGSRLVPQAP